jgi:hypothetical protein
MHGIIFKEMQRYVSIKFGLPAWYALLKGADMTHQLYLPTQRYPHKEITALIAGVSRLSGQSVAATLEAFGEFLVPNLLQAYGSMINPNWRTLDLLEHTENTMHQAVRYADHSASPPRLLCTRTGPNEVVLHYTSVRNMSSLGVGIIRGFARHYGEQVTITRTLHPDHPTECLIIVRLEPDRSSCLEAASATS